MKDPAKGSTPATRLVAERLMEKGLRRVLVVDDCYDASTRNDLEHNELAEFWDALDIDSPEQQEVLTEILGSVPRSEEEIGDAGVAALYERRDDLGLLQEAFDGYLRPTLELKHAVLNGFVSCFRDDLGLEVQTYGTKDTHDPGHTDIVFLDYYLGTPRDEASVAAARDAVRRILKPYPDGAKKPLVVLISSHGDVKGLSEEFRSLTGIVGGMFYFVPKSHLTDRVMLLLKLDMLAAALPVGHRIQQFIDVIEGMKDSIASEFLAGIKRLNLDDYVYIQRLSLQADGHPLGDYLLWLYSAYFGHLLFEHALRGERRELDKLTFADWLPSHAVPSSQLTTMYHTALFDTTVGPLGEHPRWNPGTGMQASGNEEPDVSPTKIDAEGVSGEDLTAGRQGPGESTSPALATRDKAPDAAEAELADPAGTERGRTLAGVGPHGSTSDAGTDLPHDDKARSAASRLPRFNLGDVFVNSLSTQLLMVSNPACDLAFTPDDERLPDPDDSIVLIPGKLEQLGSASASAGLRTELFEHDGKSYRVLWQPKRVKTIAHKKAADWLESNGFTRVARLRVPFSLEIQHHFAANLTRVGVPVPPPFYRPLCVALYGRGADGGHASLPITDPDAGAFVIDTTREGEKCRLTAGLVDALQAHLNEIARGDLLTVNQDSLSEQEVKRRERAQRRIERAHKSLEDFLAWRSLGTSEGGVATEIQRFTIHAGWCRRRCVPHRRHRWSVNRVVAATGPFRSRGACEIPLRATLGGGPAADRGGRLTLL